MYNDQLVYEVAIWAFFFELVYCLYTHENVDIFGWPLTSICKKKTSFILKLNWVWILFPNWHNQWTNWSIMTFLSVQLYTICGHLQYIYFNQHYSKYVHTEYYKVHDSQVSFFPALHVVSFLEGQ